MESNYEFGKEARENELARLVRRRRNGRRALIIGLFVVIGIVIFSFRTHIKDAVTPGGKNPVNKSGSKSAKKHSRDASKGNVNIVQRWDLPNELLEISGLTWLDNDRLGCVQDEKGIVFIYNTKSSSVEKQIAFAGAGDYEGLALAGETLWVLRSDGNLFEINSISSSKPKITEHDTPLTAAHNTEGLCYDKKNNRLLVTVKENVPKKTGHKGIYSFDLPTRKMDSKPVMEIDLGSEFFKDSETSNKKTNKESDIMPSGITVHPLTGDIYITEGRKSKLLVTNDAAVVMKLYQLDKTTFVQPEGITFSPAGELFISNEGTTKPGNILKVELGD